MSGDKLPLARLRVTDTTTVDGLVLVEVLVGDEPVAGLPSSAYEIRRGCGNAGQLVVTTHLDLCEAVGVDHGSDE